MKFWPNFLNIYAPPGREWEQKVQWLPNGCSKALFCDPPFLILLSVHLNLFRNHRWFRLLQSQMRAMRVLLLSLFSSFLVFAPIFLKKKSHKNNFVWPVQEKLIPNVNRSPVDFASFQPVLWFFYRFCARPVTGFIQTGRGSSSRSDRLVQSDFHYTVIYIYIRT